jgi:hypothetical protein
MQIITSAFSAVALVNLDQWVTIALDRLVANRKYMPVGRVYHLLQAQPGGRADPFFFSAETTKVLIKQISCQVNHFLSGKIIISLSKNAS